MTRPGVPSINAVAAPEILGTQLFNAVVWVGEVVFALDSLPIRTSPCCARASGFLRAFCRARERLLACILELLCRTVELAVLSQTPRRRALGLVSCPRGCYILVILDDRGPLVDECCCVVFETVSVWRGEN